MSSSGEVFLYTCDSTLDPRALLAQTFALARAAAVTEVWRTVGKDNAWERFCASIGRPVEPTWRVRPEELHRGIRMHERAEYFARKMILGEAQELWRSGTCMSASFEHESWREIDAELRRTIPSAVSGGFVPSSLGCRIGFHDLFDHYEESYGRYIARAFFSVRMFGWGMPNDWPEFRRLFFSSPVIVELKREAEQFAGPLQECILFDG